MTSLNSAEMARVEGGGVDAVADIAQFQGGYIAGSLSIFIVGPTLGSSVALVTGLWAAFVN